MGDNCMIYSYFGGSILNSKMFQRIRVLLAEQGGKGMVWKTEEIRDALSCFVYLFLDNCTIYTYGLVFTFGWLYP